MKMKADPSVVLCGFLTTCCGSGVPGCFFFFINGKPNTHFSPWLSDSCHYPSAGHGELGLRSASSCPVSSALCSRSSLDSKLEPRQGKAQPSQRCPAHLMCLVYLSQPGPCLGEVLKQLDFSPPAGALCPVGKCSTPSLGCVCLSVCLSV